MLVSHCSEMATKWLKAHLLRVGLLESNYSSLSCFKQRRKGISVVRFRCYSQVRLSSVLVTVLPGLVREEASLCHLVSHPAQDKSHFFHHGAPMRPRHALQPLAQLLGASTLLRRERQHAPASRFIPKPIQTLLIHLQLPTKRPACRPHKFLCWEL